MPFFVEFYHVPGMFCRYPKLIGSAKEKSKPISDIDPCDIVTAYKQIVENIAGVIKPECDVATIVGFVRLSLCDPETAWSPAWTLGNMAHHTAELVATALLSALSGATKSPIAVCSFRNVYVNAIHPCMKLNDPVRMQIICVTISHLPFVRLPFKSVRRRSHYMLDNLET